MSVEMWKVDSLHRDAMELVDIAERQGRERIISQEEVQSLLKIALNREADACLMLKNEDLEPTRSVLFRSAAWIAVKCGKFLKAEELVQQGLDGNPPEAIRQELLEVRTEIEKLRQTV